MAEHITVATDCRPEHRAALDWAVERVARNGGNLELVFVIEHLSGEGDEPDSELVRAAGSLLDEEAEFARARLARRSAPAHAARNGGRPLRDTGTGSAGDLSTRYAYGSVATELEKASRGADLFVMGTRNAHDEHTFAGALSVRTAAGAGCAAVLVPHSWTSRGRGVVVGVDGEPTAELAIAFAADEADALDEPLNIVCAGYDTHPLLTRPDFLIAGLVDEAVPDEGRESIIRAAVRTALERRPSLDVRAAVIAAEPARALVEAASEARMLVVGAHNGHGPKRFGLGSVSHDVLLNVSVPVAVIHGGDAPAAPHR